MVVSLLPVESSRHVDLVNNRVRLTVLEKNIQCTRNLIDHVFTLKHNVNKAVIEICVFKQNH